MIGENALKLVKMLMVMGLDSGGRKAVKAFLLLQWRYRDKLPVSQSNGR